MLSHPLRQFAAVAIAVFLPGLAHGLDVSAGGTYLDLDLSGKVQSDGTVIDVESDLSIDGDQSLAGFLRLDGDRHHLSFSFMSIEYKGDSVVQRDIVFGNQTFSLSTRVQSSLEYSLYEIQYQYDLLNLEILSVSPLIKVDVFDAEVRLRDSTGATDERYDESLPVPTVGINARLEMSDYVYVSAQFNGIAYDSNSYIEYGGTVGIEPFPFLFVETGYKRRNLDFDDGNDLIDIREDGWFVGAGLIFEF